MVSARERLLREAFRRRWMPWRTDRGYARVSTTGPRRLTPFLLPLAAGSCASGIALTPNEMHCAAPGAASPLRLSLRLGLLVGTSGQVRDRVRQLHLRRDVRLVILGLLRLDRREGLIHVLGVEEVGEHSADARNRLRVAASDTSLAVIACGSAVRQANVSARGRVTPRHVTFRMRPHRANTIGCRLVW